MVVILLGSSSKLHLSSQAVSCFFFLLIFVRRSQGFVPKPYICLSCLILFIVLVYVNLVLLHVLCLQFMFGMKDFLCCQVSVLAYIMLLLLWRSQEDKNILCECTRIATAPKKIGLLV